MWLLQVTIIDVSYYIYTSSRLMIKPTNKQTADPHEQIKSKQANN